MIRYVNAKRHRKPTSSSNNDDNNYTGMEVRYKEVGDPRSALTEADIASQFVIIECLRSIWGEELKIIGEEDDDDDECANDDENNEKSEDTNTKKDLSVFEKYQVHSPNDKSVRKDIFDSCTTKENMSTDDVVLLSDVTLYIDPM